MHHALDEGEVDFVGRKFRCAVLDVAGDPVRVISGTEFMRVLGIYRSGALSTRRSEDDDLRIPLYLAHKNLRPFILSDEPLVHALKNPVRYRQEGGGIAEGIPGHVLRRILGVWVRAHAGGQLGPSQVKIAEAAKKILDGLVDVAIDALIDEATGYQSRRAQNALQELLKVYVLPEFRPYHTKFPSSYYEQIYRVMGWPYDASSSQRTAYIGKLTNRLIYDRMPPGVHDALRVKNPTDPDTKRRKKKHFSLLTPDIGDSHLEKLIDSTITLLRATPDGQWKFFEMLFKQAYPPDQSDLFHAQEIARLNKPT
ncbi:hypothetical protein D3273_23070 [Lichenibacterium minor]|uniref:Bacteriophage Mx8 p63 C-terminal domain-containing protein n=1 Tax=Lichenibacterium minor TaxID=2316528 RepID=A0A4Q2U480_9HYPH|nr:P63C domain-containing protein [Lichenibacterium minor]RYC29586.1 hypothetical protein D3273_23070 [Lichenibacterium minor]